MKTITPLELQLLIEANTPLEILDVRPRVAFETCHVHGAHSLPLGDLTLERFSASRELPTDQPIYVVSETGNRAEFAVENLERHGLEGFVTVEGGMQAWQRHGLPVDLSGNVKNTVAEHHQRQLETGIIAETPEFDPWDGRQ